MSKRLSTNLRNRRAPLAIEALERRNLLANEIIDVTTLLDTSEDDGLTSLREAIALAESRPGEDVIRFDASLSGELSLESNLPGIASNVEIHGPGQSRLSIRGYQGVGGSYARAIFHVLPTGRLMVSRLTLADGQAQYGPGGDSSFISGGAILNTGYVSLHSVTFSDNAAQLSGGAIYNAGTLSLDQCWFEGNTAQFGGAIANVNGNVTMRDTAFMGNGANFSAGGAYSSQGGGLLVADSTFAGNTARGDGGALYLRGTTFIIANSTISGNSCGLGGGAIHAGESSGRLSNCTIAFNRADSDSDGNASNTGGGIRAWPQSLITLHNCIVANNHRGLPLTQIRDEISGPVVSASSFNLIGTSAGLTGIAHGQNNNFIGNDTFFLDPQLDSLGDNGGPTPTHRPLEQSPAINAGSSAVALGISNENLLEDQRGVRRVTNRFIDIGAFEVNRLPDIDVPGQPPIISEGDVLDLAASGKDPDDDVLQFAWDLNNDGVFTDATGPKPTLQWSELVDLGVANGTATYPVQLRVADGSGEFVFRTTRFQLNNSKPLVSLGFAPISGVEGAELAIDALSFDFGTPETFTYTWTVLKSNEPYFTTDDVQLRFTPDDNGLYRVTVIVSDGEATGTASRDVVVSNAAPAVVIDMPESAPEGEITLRATITDPGSADTHTHEWSVRRDGAVIATSTNPAFTFVAPDNGSYAVTVTVTDDEGLTATDTRTLNVVNAPPQNLWIEGPANYLVGQWLNWTVHFDDPGSEDQHIVDWIFFRQGRSVSGKGSTAFVGGYDASSWTLRFTVRDDEGGLAVVERPVDGLVAMLRANPLNPELMDLHVGSTEGNDVIHFNPHEQGIEVIFNGASAGVFQVTGNILVAAGLGNDFINVDPAIQQAAYLYGEQGDDTLQGGAGDDVLAGHEGNDLLLGRRGADQLFGEQGDDVLRGGRGDDILAGWLGNDLLRGGRGQDVLFGSEGRDTLRGGLGGDLLTAGRATFEFDPLALRRIRDEWLSPRDYKSRLANLQGDTGAPEFDHRLNGNVFFLTHDTPTVLEDGESDELRGGDGLDAFFGNSQIGAIDTLSSLEPPETLIELPSP